MSTSAMALHALDVIQEISASHNSEAELQSNGIRLNFEDDLVVVARPNLCAPTIKFIATCFDTIPDKHVGEVCELVAILNLSLPIGYFAVEVETREFRFYYDMPYEFAGADLRSIIQSTLKIVIGKFRQIRPVAKMINNDLLSIEKALSLLSKPAVDDADIALNEVCRLIDNMIDERDVVKVEKDLKRITIVKHDSVGTPRRKTTIRVDSRLRMVYVVSVMPDLNSEVSSVIRKTRLRYGSAKVDECRRELVVSGAVKFGRRSRQRNFSDLLEEHFQSVQNIHNAIDCRA